MNEKFMDICQRGIDGEASVAELTALEDYLRGNTAARLECEQLEAAIGLLSRVNVVTPPTDLKNAIMKKIGELEPPAFEDTMMTSGNGAATTLVRRHPVVEFLRSFVPRDALTFASGLAAGAVLIFAMSPAAIREDDQASLSGTIGVLVTGAEFHNELVVPGAGTLSSHLSGQKLLADLAANSGISTEWTIEYDPSTLRVEEILQSAGDEGLLDQSRGRIFIREPGESRYAVLFHVREGVTDPQLTLSIRSGSSHFDGVLHGRSTLP